MPSYSKQFLAQLYQTMVRIRLCEESLVEPINRGEIKCPVHLYSGQEAVATGVCAALNKNDFLFGNHRSHGHYLAQGGSMREMIAEIYGKHDGCARGRGGSMHICAPEVGFLGAAPIVGGTISLAVGSALAAKIKDSAAVAVSFFGDGATGEGTLYEALNLAALKKLPVLFICENNLYSTHMSIRDCRPTSVLYKIGIPFEVKSYREDGNDVLAVYELTKKAVNFCRRGEGPVFIEFMTYRLRGHVGPDDNVQGTHIDIRPKKEIECWKRKDPLKKFEKYLLKNGLKKGDILALQKQSVREVENVYKDVLGSDYPKEGELSHYVFKK